MYTYIYIYICIYYTALSNSPPCHKHVHWLHSRSYMDEHKIAQCH